MTEKYRLLSAAALLAIGTYASPGYAQSGAPAEPAAANDTAQPQDAATGSITVTARRREESLVDVPLAISVVTAAKLEQLDIRDTNTLAKYVPGLEFNDYSVGDARNDRGIDRVLAFRGLAIGAAASLFLDGAAVPTKEVPASMDIGQVEVLRGPQSVYFGQSTMTGAVSYRTKDIPKHWQGEAETSLAERAGVMVQGSIAGPVLPGLLGIRVTGLLDRTDGYITNDYNNGKLGNRDRKSISTTINLTPARNLEFKGYFNYFKDNDGPGATPFITAGYANCRLPGATENTFCGKIPGFSNSVNYSNTNVPTDMANFIYSSPLTKGWGFGKHVGSQRASYNSDLVSNWQVSDYIKVQAITAFHNSLAAASLDGIGQPVQSTFPYKNYFYDIMTKTKDFSQEVRVSSDPNRPLSWTIGSNYLNVTSKNQSLVDFMNQAGALNPLDLGIGTSKTRTIGIFGGAYYRPFDRLTLSAEGRYQWDRRTSIQQDAAQAVTFDASATFRSFNPRVSADYDIGRGRKIYASYSTGTDPGGFNTTLENYRSRPDVVAQIENLLGASSTQVKQERLRIGEVGLKGNFGESKGYFDINLYYGKLNNQQVYYQVLIPLLGYAVGATSNIGQTEIYGVEAQGNYNFTKSLSLATTFAWNHSVRTKFLNTSGDTQFGTENFNGVKFSNVPEYSGSAIMAYTHPISTVWNIFGNAAYTYRGKQFVDLYNSGYIKGRSQVDLRGGLSNDHYTIELFMTNLLNDRKYLGGSVAPDYGTLTYNAFTGAVAPPRTLGGRLRVKL